MTDLETIVFTILIYVLPHFILLKPNWVSIFSDKLVWIHTVNCRGPLYTFLLTIDENGHVLFSSSFLFGLFRRSEFSFRFGHTHQPSLGPTFPCPATAHSILP